MSAASREYLINKTFEEHYTSARPTPEDEADDEATMGLDNLEADDGYEMEMLSYTKSKSAVLRGNPTESASDENGDLEEDVDGDGGASPTRRSRRRRSSAQSFQLYTPDEERCVIRKLDTRLVLFVAFLYMMSFLDRSNIGNAKVAGLARDLRLSDDQFEWLLTAFYISYILFEWMTLCYKIFPPHIYIACCVFAWGAIASLQAVTTSFAFMLILRALLGIGEAAFVGMPFYLSFFFRREELAFRTGMFIAAAPLATSFASGLAYAIVKFGDSAGIASWRLLFLMEGFPACVLAVWTWVWIPDSPSTARWLSTRERKIAAARMRKETKVDMHLDTTISAESEIPRNKRRFRWREVRSTLVDLKAYLAAGIFFCCNVAFSSMPVFLPTIVNQMGYSRLASQGLSAPPFVLAFASVLITAFASDKYKSRSIPLILHAFMASSGYIFLAIAGTFRIGHIWRYLAVFPICAGFFSAVTIVITWTVNNQASDEGKGTGMALLNVIGQLGPLLGTRVYPDADAPFFVKGMSVCAGAMLLVALLAFLLRAVLIRKNASLKSECEVVEGQGLVRGRREIEFRFML